MACHVLIENGPGILPLVRSLLSPVYVLEDSFKYNLTDLAWPQNRKREFIVARHRSKGLFGGTLFSPKYGF